MCTALHLTSGTSLAVFGRTMDFHYELHPHMFAIPAGHTWAAGTESWRDQYAILSLGSGKTPVLFDGINEKGLAGAKLYFPGYAHFEKPGMTGRKEIPAAHVLHFLLGTCGSVEDVRRILPEYAVTEQKNPVTGQLLPLHWMLADAGGACIVVEITRSGLHLYDNPVGVMTNSPDFPWHLTNLRNYMEALPIQIEMTKWGRQKLYPFGQGLATGNLPGGYAPPARFVRAAYGAAFGERPSDAQGLMRTAFHILEGVSIPKGLVVTKEGLLDHTQYTACIDVFQKRYYLRTYDHLNIRSISLSQIKLEEGRVKDLGPLWQLPVDPDF